MVIAKPEKTSTANPPIIGASRSPRMAPGDSAGMLGDWAGTHYSKTYQRTKSSHSAVAFRNRRRCGYDTVCHRSGVRTTMMQDVANAYT